MKNFFNKHFKEYYLASFCWWIPSSCENHCNLLYTVYITGSTEGFNLVPGDLCENRTTGTIARILVCVKWNGIGRGVLYATTAFLKWGMEGGKGQLFRGGVFSALAHGGFIKGILRGVRCTKSLRVLFLHRRPPSWTTLVLYSRAVFIFNEPAFSVYHRGDKV